MLFVVCIWFVTLCSSLSSQLQLSSIATHIMTNLLAIKCIKVDISEVRKPPQWLHIVKTFLRWLL